MMSSSSSNIKILMTLKCILHILNSYSFCSIQWPSSLDVGSQHYDYSMLCLVSICGVYVWCQQLFRVWCPCGVYVWCIIMSGATSATAVSSIYGYDRLRSIMLQLYVVATAISAISVFQLGISQRVLRPALYCIAPCPNSLAPSPIFFFFTYFFLVCFHPADQLYVQCLQICAHVFIDRPQNCAQILFCSRAGLCLNCGRLR